MTLPSLKHFLQAFQKLPTMENLDCLGHAVDNLLHLHMDLTAQLDAEAAVACYPHVLRPCHTRDCIRHLWHRLHAKNWDVAASGLSARLSTWRFETGVAFGANKPTACPSSFWVPRPNKTPCKPFTLCSRNFCCSSRGHANWSDIGCFSLAMYRFAIGCIGRTMYTETGWCRRNGIGCTTGCIGACTGTVTYWRTWTGSDTQMDTVWSRISWWWWWWLGCICNQCFNIVSNIGCWEKTWLHFGAALLGAFGGHRLRLIGWCTLATVCGKTPHLQPVTHSWGSPTRRQRSEHLEARLAWQGPHNMLLGIRANCCSCWTGWLTMALVWGGNCIGCIRTIALLITSWAVAPQVLFGLAYVTLQGHPILYLLDSVSWTEIPPDLSYHPFHRQKNWEAKMLDKNWTWKTLSTFESTFETLSVPSGILIWDSTPLLASKGILQVSFNRVFSFSRDWFNTIIWTGICAITIFLKIVTTCLGIVHWESHGTGMHWMQTAGTWGIWNPRHRRTGLSRSKDLVHWVLHTERIGMRSIRHKRRKKSLSVKVTRITHCPLSCTMLKVCPLSDETTFGSSQAVHQIQHRSEAFDRPIGASNLSHCSAPRPRDWRSNQVNPVRLIANPALAWALFLRMSNLTSRTVNGLSRLPSKCKEILQSIWWYSLPPVVRIVEPTL